MDDIASLGFAIDSSSITKANSELAKMPAAAGQAEQAVGKLSAENAAAAKMIAAMEAAFAKATASALAMSKAHDTVTAALNKADSGAAAATRSIAAMDVAARKATENATGLVTATKEIANTGGAAATAIDKTTESVRRRTQYDNEATAAFKRGTADVVAATQMRTRAGGSLVTQALAIAAVQGQANGVTTLAARAADVLAGAWARMAAAGNGALSFLKSLGGAGAQASASTAGVGASSAAAAISTGLFAAASARLAVVLGGALATAFAAVNFAAFLKGTADAEEVTTRLGSTLKSTASISGQSISSLNDQAAALQKVSVYGDEAIRSAEGILLTFTKIRGIEFSKATASAADLAYAMGKDLKDAATDLGKALNNPAAGIADLVKIGVDFTASQKAMITSMQAAGNVAGAQEVILKQLEVQFGGSAKAARETLGGALASLKNALADLFVLGRDASEPLRKAIEGLIAAVQDPAFMAFVDTVGKALFAAATLAVQGITALVDGITFLAKNIDVLGVAAGAAGALLLVAFGPSVLATMAGGFVALGVAGVEAIGAITTAMIANPFGAIAVGITAAITAIYVFRDEISKAIGVDVVGVAKDAANYVIGSFVAAFHDIQFIWSNFPDIIGAAVIGAANAVARGMGQIIQTAASGIDWLIDKANSIPGVNLPKIGSLGTVQQADNPYAERLSGAVDHRNAQIQSDLTKNYLGQIPNPFAGSSPSPQTFGSTAIPRPDAGKGGGSTADVDKLQKLTDSLKAAADAQDAMTAAARNGDVAFQEQQAHAEALQKAIDYFGGKVDATTPKVQALAAELEKYILRTKEGAAAQTFVVQTTELQKQNDLLQAQISLMNEAPEIQAREIAVIKAKQEAQKAGNALTADDIENRRKAIEANETLKSQAEQLKQVNALWTEPLKSALQSIQKTGADAFEQILETGNLSFQSLAQTFTSVIRRMAAEFLALATIRPVMSIFVDAIGPGGAGLISGNTASQLGFPTGGASVGGGSGFSMPSLGGSGVGGMLGAGFLNKPIFGGGIDSEIANWSTYGTSAQGASGLFSSSATFGQALGGIGGAVGIGMGINSLLSGGGSVGSIAGGAAGILGGGLGLAGALLPALAGTLGPIGIGVGLLGAILPSLLGGGGPKIPPMPGLNYSYNETPQSSVASLIQAAGGTAIDGRLYTGGVGQGTTHTWDGKQWVGQDYTQANITSPTGQVSFVGGGQGVSPEQAADQVVAAMFNADVVSGAIKNVSDTLKQIFSANEIGTTQAAQDAITFAKSYDALGKAANPVKDSIDALNQQFQTLSQQATTYGLSLDPINDALAKQSKRSAQDFIDAMLDPLAVQMRALDDARDSAISSAQYIKDNVTGVYVDLDKITDYYGKQRLALEDQFYQGGLTNLQNLIKQLAYGDLANASPTLQLSGTRAAYETAYGQARGGDTSAIAGFSGVAQDYLTAARSYFGSSPEYQALVEQIRAAATEIQAVATGGGSTGGGSASVPSATAVAQSQQIAQLIQMQQDQAQENADLKRQLKENNDLMQRLISAKV